jgi:Mrp family chromosome partitioning ATPase
MDWVADNFDKWRQENPSSVKDALKFAASNRDYRDASQLERLDMDIRNAQTLKGMGIQNIDIERLKAKREALAAGCHD